MPHTDTELIAALRHLIERTPYQKGVLDVLRLLGLLTDSQESPEPTGEVAAQLLAALAAHAEEGQAIGFDWNSLEANGARGVDLLRAVEQARMERTAGAQPTRDVRVVQAVIKARRKDVEFYLMQYDAHAGQYQPIGGKIEAEDADPEAALRREIAEELAFDTPLQPEDCMLTLLRTGWETVKVSPTYGTLTRYDFAFYHVSDIRFPIEQTGYTRWLRRGEIERARADDSRPISAIYLEALGIEHLDGLEPGIIL